MSDIFLRSITRAQGHYIIKHLPLDLANDIYKLLFADCLLEIGQFQKLVNTYHTIFNILTKNTGKNYYRIVDTKYIYISHKYIHRRHVVDFDYHYDRLRYLFYKQCIIVKKRCTSSEGDKYIFCIIDPPNTIVLRRTCFTCMNPIVKSKSSECPKCGMEDNNINFCSKCLSNYICDICILYPND